ncbi:fatty acid desaturase [Flavihumibacter rivuli]|uniref:fatty acid desaturase family protein n=1 Tax=Flavihumibacter rivuli TaxID=2838156 RepID=UPI001BDE81DE|nr:fatty acid desaturase [Flavihumibacter rivuli]ULQ56508.1 fatty acid desaturase [Flavihumibacter rivuli]
MQVQKPTYQQNTGQKKDYLELKRLVEERMQYIHPARIHWARTRSIIFPLLYLGLWGLAVSGWFSTAFLYTAYFLMGILIVLIFLNLVHEAVHGSLYGNKSREGLVLLLFDLLGANSYIWKKRHILMHHNFPNVDGWDTDIEQSAFFNVAGKAGKNFFTRNQHWLMFFLYPLYLPNWLLVRDFKDFFDAGRTIRKMVRIPLVEYFKLFFFKTVFITYVLVLPVWLGGYTLGQAFCAFLVLLFTASVFALLVLLTPHANIHNSFPVPEADRKMPSSWMVHQFLTTNDIRLDNPLARLVLGNFNYHLAHHLFPNIHHVYMPEVTGVIREFAATHWYPYRAYGLLESLRNHYLLLKQHALEMDILEEDM